MGKFGAITRMIQKYRIDDELEYRRDNELLQSTHILLGSAVSTLAFAVFFEFLHPGVLTSTEDLYITAIWFSTFCIGLAGVNLLRLARRLPEDIILRQ
jgi:O-antigen/teichoic acid export membrane protein